MKLKLLFIFMLFANFAYTQDTEWSSLQFLRINPSPEASALGNSYTSIIGNSDTMYYNPGSLAFVQNMSFSLAYSRWFDNLNYAMFSSAIDLRNVGVIGLGFTTLLYDDIAETLDSGDLTGRQLGSSDSLFMATYAKKINEKTGLGVNIKYAYENVAAESISGLALDTGINYHEIKNKWGIGVVIQNLGLSLKTINQNFQLPLNFKLGGNYEISLFKNNPDEHVIIIASDLGKGLDYGYSISAGIGYSFQKFISVRCGYQDNGAEPGFKIGGGLKYKTISIDYAYTPIENLGNIHKIEITYQFNQTLNPIKETPEVSVIETVTKRGIEINISDVVFETKKADIRPEFMKILDKVSDMVKEYKDYNIVIEGHTDNVGTDEDNLELSLQRAKAVFDYFIDKEVNPKNLSYIGYGKKRPLADNSTEEGRQKNRCVNIVITKKAAK